MQPDRLSLWPTRQQRRHAATIAFNSKVENALAAILNRLEGIEQKMQTVISDLSQRANTEHRLEDVEQNMQAVISDLSQRVNTKPMHTDVSCLATHAASMELLLFRTILEDFSRIGHMIAERCGGVSAAEPDPGRLPEKP